MFQCLWSGNLLYCFYIHPPPTLLFESIIGWFSVWKASLHLPELTNSHQWGSYKRKKLFWQTCQERLIRSTMCTQSKYNWGEELASIWLPFHSTRLSTKINSLNKQINLQVAVNFGQCNRSIILLSCVHMTLSPGKNKQTNIKSLRITTQGPVLVRVALFYSSSSHKTDGFWEMLYE